jgi:hypothetical protein
LSLAERYKHDGGHVLALIVVVAWEGVGAMTATCGLQSWFSAVLTTMTFLKAAVSLEVLVETPPSSLAHSFGQVTVVIFGVAFPHRLCRSRVQFWPLYIEAPTHPQC